MLVLGAALVSRAARPQRPAMPVIGLLGSGTAEAYGQFLAPLHDGLAEAGYVEGRDVLIEYRWAGGDYDRLPALAAELVSRPVDLIITTGGITSALAAKNATRTIPIVFTTGGDPVKLGLVDSLARPGGSMTGVSTFTSVLDVKRLELLHELMPGARLIGALVNPANPTAETNLTQLEAAARSFGLRLHVASATVPSAIAAAFASFVAQGADALLVEGDPMLASASAEIVALAARHALPALYYRREFTTAGGLVSYGVSFAVLHHQMGVYAGWILKGASPAGLPVQQPTRFELVINIKTAKALGITIPQSVLLRADELIE